MPCCFHETGYRSLTLFLLSLGLMLTELTPSYGAVISSVDTSLSSSQKFYLQVDSKPFFMVGIQVRLDKERYSWNWNEASRAAIVAQAAADGFNTLQIPIQWVEIETSKDNFNWTILDEYLALAKTNNLKVEILWFSQNHGGHVGWMTSTQLRVPGYVLWAPSQGSTQTTSDYAIARSVSDYTLDLADNNLRDRETYVVGRLMEHISSWDASNGNPHTAIGIQLGNEVALFSNNLIVSYYNAVASSVKNSSYSIWTRMNGTQNSGVGRASANETLRATVGTYVDFVGVDLYTVYGFTATNFQNYLPSQGKNLNMIMEGGGAEDPTCASLRLAAISGDNSFLFYDLCGPDGHGLYDRNGAGYQAHGGYVDEVRTGNKLLTSDVYDLARLSAKRPDGLFVHNWAGNSAAATTGIYGISFTPPATSAQAISICRSSTEIVLMNTGGGTFTFPTNLIVYSASSGYFDTNNIWVIQGAVACTSTNIIPPAGATVLLSYSRIASVPAGPTGLGATAVLTDQINLQWIDNDVQATGYKLEQSTDGTNFTEIATLASNVTSYANTGLLAGTTYYYRIRAYNTVGSSAYSNLTQATTPTAGSGQIRVTAILPGVSTASATAPTLATSSTFDMSGGNAVALLATTEASSGNATNMFATFAGQPMILGVGTNYTAQGAFIFYLINPTNASGGFVITSSNNSGGFAYSAIALGNVGSIAGSNGAANNLTSGAVSLNYTTATNGGFILGAVVNNGFSSTYGPPTFSQNNNANQLFYGPALVFGGSSGHLHVYGGVPTAGTYSDIYTNCANSGSQRNAYVTIALDAGAVAPVNPNPPVLLASLAGNLLTLSWSTNAGWTLQQQTNSLSKGLGTNWVDVPGSPGITTTIIPVDPASPAVFYRLKL